MCQKRFEDSGTLRQARVSTWTDFFFSRLRCKHHQGMLSHLSFLSFWEPPSVLVISVLLRSILNWPFLSVGSVQPSRVGSSCQSALQRASSRRAPSPTSRCPRHACTGCSNFYEQINKNFDRIILFQPLLQTAFLLDASCRTTGTSAQARTKPGRQAVTFLLVSSWHWEASW